MYYLLQPLLILSVVCPAQEKQRFILPIIATQHRFKAIKTKTLGYSSFNYLWSQEKIMGLKMRVTYNDTDHVYEIIDGAAINKDTTELKIILNGQPITLLKDTKKVWVLQESEVAIDPELVQALGRSVSLRYRL